MTADHTETITTDAPQMTVPSELVMVDEAEEVEVADEKERSMHQIINQQGWTPQTQLMLIATHLPLTLHVLLTPLVSHHLA